MSKTIIRHAELGRRELLQWMIAAGAALAGGNSFAGNQAGPTGARGYGNDPLLTEPPRQPWPRRVLGKDLEALEELVDVVLPATSTSSAASEVGVVLFFEEWLSAPYATQIADFALLLPLLEQRASGVPLAVLTHGEAWERFRLLTGSAYFTTPVGMREMGYVGNIPQSSFSGPPDAVKRMLDERYAELG